MPNGVSQSSLSLELASSLWVVADLVLIHRYFWQCAADRKHAEEAIAVQRHAGAERARKPAHAHARDRPHPDQGARGVSAA